MQTPSYPGDKAAAEILRRADCRYTVDTLKALLAGVLMGHSAVPPKVVLDEIEFGGIDQPQFGDKKLAEEFLGVFFGLWNKAASHRNPDHPFSFSQPDPSWKSDDTDIWFKYAESREVEIGEFLIGLGLSETPTLIDLADHGDTDAADYLPHLLAKHLGKLERQWRKLQKQKAQDASPICNIVQAIDGDLKKYHRKYIEKMMLLLPDLRPDAKSVVRQGSKVGRNDPCPCGSGKKFKQCCLK